MLKDIAYHPMSWQSEFNKYTQEKSLPLLLGLLADLEKTPVIAARQALVLNRLGRRNEAHALLDQYPKDSLCIGVRTILMTASNDPAVMKDLLENYHPEDLPRNSFTDLEGARHVQFSRAVAAITLCFSDVAEKELEKYEHYVFVFQDPRLKYSSRLEHARLHLNFGRWQKAGALYSEILPWAEKHNRQVFNVACENAVWVNVLGGENVILPDWADRIVKALRGEVKAELTPDILRDHPMRAAMALQNTRELLNWWNMFLPTVKSVEKHRIRHGALLRSVMSIKPDGNDQISEFFIRVSQGLALSTTGDLEAIGKVMNAMTRPIDCIPLLVALHAACVLQVHAHIPAAPESPSKPLAVCLENLIEAYKQLSTEEAHLMIRWLRTFTPAALLLLHENVRWSQANALDAELTDAVEAIILVDSTAHFVGQKKKLPVYPVALMNKQILQILKDEPLGGTDLQQAYRHVRTLKATSKPTLLVFQVVLAEVKQKIQQYYYTA